MKNFIRFYLLCSLITTVNSCSDSDSENPIDNGNTFIEYQNEPNAEGRLLSEIYIKADNATTYVYGKSDANGLPSQAQSFAYRIDNSDKIDYVILDENQRVSFLYSEINGVKDNIIHAFTYPEEGLVNYSVYNRNWTTLEDTIINFSVVEIDGDSFTGHSLLRNANSFNSIEWNTVKNWLGVCVGVVGAVAVVGAAPTILAGVLAGIIFVGAATAAEPPLETINPNAPDTPIEVLNENQCSNSGLEVTIGADPGNLLVAIVNGSSQYYDFYWSTGESDIGICCDDITVPGDGNYYLMVVDENGCTAFASKTISSSENNYEELIIGTWLLTGSTENGINDFDPAACDNIAIFNGTTFTSTEYYDAVPDSNDCSLEDTVVSTYTIVDGIYLHDTYQGDTDVSEILELNETTLVVKSTDDGYVFVDTLTRQ